MQGRNSGSGTARFTFAVGDVHGRLDLVKRALARIGAHPDAGSCRVVFLGDYIDRGPESRAVIELLISLQRTGRVVCLKGNHEQLMLAAVTSGDLKLVRRWLQIGGEETLKSYGVAPGSNFQNAIPSAHIRWMSGLPLTTTDPHRIFVHAGLEPRTPMHRQSEQALLWIREHFLRASPPDFEAHVVHGHTPMWEGKPAPAIPELLEHRSNLDTAAYATGVLTMGIFDAEVPGGPVETIQVIGEPAPQLAAELLDSFEAENRSPLQHMRRIGRIARR